MEDKLQISKMKYLSNHCMDRDLRVLRGNLEENSEKNSEEISSVALLSPACFPVFLTTAQSRHMHFVQSDNVVPCKITFSIIFMLGPYVLHSSYCRMNIQFIYIREYKNMSTCAELDHNHHHERKLAKWFYVKV